MRVQAYRFDPMNEYYFWIYHAGCALRDKNNLFEVSSGENNMDYALRMALNNWMEAQ